MSKPRVAIIIEDGKVHNAISDTEIELIVLDRQVELTEESTEEDQTGSFEIYEINPVVAPEETEAIYTNVYNLVDVQEGYETYMEEELPEKL